MQYNSEQVSAVLHTAREIQYNSEHFGATLHSAREMQFSAMQKILSGLPPLPAGHSGKRNCNKMMMMMMMVTMVMIMMMVMIVMMMVVNFERICQRTSERSFSLGE